MSTYFYDSFGGSGTLTGRVPDTNLNPAANSGWQPSTSGYLVQGGGWLTTSGGDNAKLLSMWAPMALTGEPLVHRHHCMARYPPVLRCAHPPA